MISSLLGIWSPTGRARQSRGSGQYGEDPGLTRAPWDAEGAMPDLWRRTAGYAISAVYLLFFMEWLFHVTKPSFFSVLDRPQALLVLPIAPVPTLLLTLIALAALRPLGLRTSPTRAVLLAHACIPAFFLSAALILMIDNFTYTIMGFGVATVRSAWRFLYGLFFLGLLGWVVRRMARRLATDEAGSARFLLAGSVAAALVSLGCLLLVLATRESIDQPNSPGAIGSSRPPDIFLISGDGLEAADFERYGNPIAETSYFRALGPNAIVFENSFPNANRTAAVTAMVLTGKNAATTGKYNGARWFRGEDAYQHLPGLLRSHGYRSIQIGTEHHVDSFDWGMRNAFDVHNHTVADRSFLERISDRVGGRLNWEFHFAQVVAQRIGDRIAHAFGGELVEQPHLAAKPAPWRYLEGAAMVEQLRRFLDRHPGPIFAQLHSMSTKHGTEIGRRSFDDAVRKIVADLKRAGRFENSIIVIWSDHGRGYTTDRRLPLIIKFPTETEIPHTAWNTQTLDIAPTVLDAIGLEVPIWMEGRSLLRERDRYEPVFSVKSKFDAPGIEPDLEGATAIGGVSDMGLIVCDRSYNLRFATGLLHSDLIWGHTSPCAAEQVPTPRVAREMIIQHLVERGFGPALGR